MKSTVPKVYYVLYNVQQLQIGSFHSLYICRSAFSQHMYCIYYTRRCRSPLSQILQLEVNTVTECTAAGNQCHRLNSCRTRLSQSVLLQDTSVIDWTVAGQDCHRVYSCSIRLLQTVQLQHTIVTECTACAHDCYRLYRSWTQLSLGVQLQDTPLQSLFCSSVELVNVKMLVML